MIYFFLREIWNFTKDDLPPEPQRTNFTRSVTLHRQSTTQARVTLLLPAFVGNEKDFLGIKYMKK